MSGAKWLDTAYAHPDDIAPDRWTRLMMSREEYCAMVKERATRDQAAPKVGEPAPDFVAHRLSSNGSMTGEQFRLSRSLGRPIALVFGSYT